MTEEKRSVDSIYQMLWRYQGDGMLPFVKRGAFHDYLFGFGDIGIIDDQGVWIYDKGDGHYEGGSNHDDKCRFVQLVAEAVYRRCSRLKIVIEYRPDGWTSENLFCCYETQLEAAINALHHR